MVEEAAETAGRSERLSIRIFPGGSQEIQTAES
jgi:hypothetical protein